MDSERQTIKSNLLLLGSEYQQERRYLSSTLLILPGQMQPRCSPAWRTHHAYTTCLVQESGPSHQRHEFAGEVRKCEDSQQMTIWGTAEAATRPGHLVTQSKLCLSKFTKEHSHVLMRAAQPIHRLCLSCWPAFLMLGLCEIRQTHTLSYSWWAAATMFWPSVHFSS